MRAWLLILAVLATFQTIVQVASTEDNNISSIFIRAIQPVKKDFNHTTTATVITQNPPSAKTTTVSTKLADFFSLFLYTEQEKENKTIVYKPHKSDSDKRTTTTIIKTTKEQMQNINNTHTNEVFKRDQKHKNLHNRQQNKNLIKNHNKMALKESEIEQLQQKQQHKENIQQNQKIQQNQMHIEEDTKLNIESSSTHHKPHHNHHNHRQQLHHHQQLQQQKHNSQPASQQQTLVSDNLASSSSSSSTTSQITSSLDSHKDNDALSSSSSPSSSSIENDDSANSVKTQEPQENAKKDKPDPSVLSGLLSLLNMANPPKIDRSKKFIPEKMKQMHYAQTMGQEIVSVHVPKTGLDANTVRSFTHQDSKIDDRFLHHHQFRLYFDIKKLPAVEKLMAAELQLTRDAISHAILNPRLASRTLYHVFVYDITRVGVKGKHGPDLRLLDDKTIYLNSTDPVSFDVQSAVKRWRTPPKANFGLLIEVRTSGTLKPAPHHHVRLRRSADEEHEHWQRKQPLLFTYTDDPHHKSCAIKDVSTRSKRAGGGHHRRTHRRKNNECQRHSLYVDFADVGWSDWIVAPPGYDAFYCHGRCPFPIAEHLNSTNHAVLQTIMNSIHPGKAPKACCVPTQLEDISMLYLDDQNTVVLKNYQDMAVVGCGCR